MQAIIDRLDAQFADPGYRYALLRREDWQTLKSVVLAQQTNNMPSTKSCTTCQNEGDDYGSCFYCCRKCLSDWEPRKTSCVG